VPDKPIIRSLYIGNGLGLEEPRARGNRLGAALRRALCLGGLVVVWGLAPQVQAQSLKESLEHTYRTNPILQASRAELRSVNEGVPQALSGWRPSVTLNGSAGQSYTDQEKPTDRSDSATPRNVELALEQPLYTGGRTVSATERAEFDVLAQRARLKAVEQDTLFDAAVAYFDVWRDQSVLELNINNERVLTRQLEAIQDRFDVGEVTRTDVAQSESRLATATADRTAAEGDLAASRAIFKRVVGLESAELKEPPSVEGLPKTREEVIDRSIKDDPSVVAATFDQLSAERQVREILGELLPEVSLNGNLEHQDETSGTDVRRKVASITAEVSIPLYQQGQVSSRVRAAKQVQSQRRLEIDAARLQAVEDAIQAWENLVTAQAQIVSFNSAVRSGEIALEGVKQENIVGTRTVLDVLDQEQELLDDRVNLVRARRDELAAQYEVLRAIGRLSGRDLALDVPLYDPEEDYKKVRNLWFGLDVPSLD